MAYVQTRGGGRTWQKVDDPSTATIASKTSGWSADSFSGGLSVDVSSYVPVGTVAVIIAIIQAGTKEDVYIRPDGDTNISNTPAAGAENHARIMRVEDEQYNGFVWLSADYKFQIAVTNVNTDIYVYGVRAVLI